MDKKRELAVIELAEVPAPDVAPMTRAVVVIEYNGPITYGVHERVKELWRKFIESYDEDRLYGLGYPENLSVELIEEFEKLLEKEGFKVLNVQHIVVPV